MKQNTSYVIFCSVCSVQLKKTLRAVLSSMVFLMFLGVLADCRAEGVVRLPQTGQIQTYSTGDDGALRKGVAWPSPRFTNPGGSTPINGSVVMDQLTGLMWTQDANAPGPSACNPGVPRYWQEALDYVACINSSSYLGHNDWRLPNRKEMKSLVNYGEAFSASWLIGQGFNNALDARYWTSTSFPPFLSTLAWEIVLQYGQTSEYDAYKDSDLARVWPVRAGHGVYAALADLPQTGQTTSYSTGDDGALRKGAPWPVPRFSNHFNGTITDELTGLMWTANGNPSILGKCIPGNSMTWDEALAHVACLNTNTYLGYTNWRVPNVNELESLVNAEYGPITDWLALQGFSIVQCDLEATPVFYWSSTSYAFDYTLAWYVDMCVGAVRPYDKGNFLVSHFSVWPVRELCAINEVRIEGTLTPFSSIQSGYNAATDNQKIQMQAATFDEDPNLARNISVTLRGGYECGYLSNPGWTTIEGTLTIRGGSVTLEKVLIR
jgi:hypothetical protein